MTVCVIPARAGSKRLPGKNTRDFMGKPVIAYSIQTARNSGLFDGIYVSTESRDIGHIAKEYGAAWMMRDPDAATDTATDADVIRECLQRLPCDYLCYLYPVAPLVTEADLKRGFACIKHGAVMRTICRGPDGRDAAAFYWIDAKKFDHDRYYTCATETVYMDADRVQDVNTFEDWLQLETKWRVMHD